MTGQLRVLVVDDSPDDLDLLLRALRNSEYEPIWERVDTAAAFELALVAKNWDLVISDWSMPRFSAPAAFAIMRSKRMDLPFIIVSGTVGEEVAVEALRAGAHDFLSKDRLTRLAPAIERERREAALRKERRTMQEQLLLTDRMASIGLLASGVAHELSSPVMCVAANLEYAIRAADELTSRGAVCTELRQDLTDATEALGRITALVQDLKTFGRGNDSTHSHVDVRQCLEFALRIAAPQIRHRAQLTKDYRDVPLIEANESRLGQVMLNLIVNAAQALEGETAAANNIHLVTRTDELGRAVIEIHDTGCGITPEVLDQLFTPFVSTKPIGVGTGLGLWICQRIVSSFGGEIRVDSQPGKGSCFSIALPTTRAAERSSLVEHA
jgi:C4-dicarboxylate-specific signal transduction histidine kinase